MGSLYYYVSLSFFFLTGSAAGPDISSKNNTSPQITSFDGRNLPSGFTLNRAKKLCFSLLTPVAKDILRRSGKLSFLLIWQLFYSNKYYLNLLPIHCQTKPKSSVNVMEKLSNLGFFLFIKQFFGKKDIKLMKMP